MKKGKKFLEKEKKRAEKKEKCKGKDFIRMGAEEKCFFGKLHFKQHTSTLNNTNASIAKNPVIISTP